MKQEKVYWHGRALGNDLGCRHGWPGQADHGMHPGDESSDDSGVRPRTCGSLSVTFEEGTSAAWLHDLLKPHVTDVMVCDPRKNAAEPDFRESRFWITFRNDHPPGNCDLGERCLKRLQSAQVGAWHPHFENRCRPIAEKRTNTRASVAPDLELSPDAVRSTGRL